MQTNANPEILLQQIWDNLHKAMQALENGNQVDMASIDSQVRSFCEIIIRQQPDEAQKSQVKLNEIISYLNNIVEKLTLQKEQVEEQIISINQRQRAFNAYGNSNTNNKIYSESNE